jgi:hypothetical protein
MIGAAFTTDASGTTVAVSVAAAIEAAGAVPAGSAIVPTPVLLPASRRSSSSTCMFPALPDQLSPSLSDKGGLRVDSQCVAHGRRFTH